MNKKKIFKNSLWVSGGQAVSRTIGFIYYILLARYLSVADFGIWNWILGLGYIFYPLADFGIERYVLKYLPRNHQKKDAYLNQLLPLRLVLAIISLFASCLFALILGSFSKAVYMFILSLALLPHNLVFLYANIKSAFEEMHYFGLSLLGVSLGYTLTGIIMMAFGLDLKWLFSSFLVGTIITFIILNFESEISLLSNWKWEPQFYRQVISESWALAVLQLISVFYVRLSLILIGILLGDYQAGIYGSASKFIEAGILFPQSLTIALFPLFSRLFTENTQRLQRAYFKILPILLVISLFFFSVMWFGGELIIPTIYGSDYLEAVPVFRLMGIVMIFFFINCLADNVIQNSKRVINFLPYRLFNFLVCLILGLILIPRMGVIGGVWALIVSEIFGLVVNNYYVINIFKSNNNHQNI